MAQLWSTVSRTLFWNFDKCEDIVFVFGLEDIRARVAPARGEWMRVLDDRYFARGDAVAVAAVDQINEHRRRCGLPGLSFAETEPTPYIRCKQRGMRAEYRSAVRALYHDWSPQERRAARRIAEGERLKLPDPVESFEHTLWRKYDDPAHLQPSERLRRHAAARHVFA